VSAVERLRRLLPAVWAGGLLCVAFIAAPAPFAMLAVADAGRVVGRIFAHEAATSLVLALLVVLTERRNGFNTNVMLALGAMFCTVAGYYALLPVMQAARAGQGALSAGQLHAISVALFAVKGLLVLALAWRATRL
jgi:hypothetical protein